MSIASELEDLQTNVAAIEDVITASGGTVTGGLANLATDVETTIEEAAEDEITVDTVISSPYNSSQASTHTFSRTSGDIIFTKIAPWEAIGSSYPFGNKALVGKYPWELSNYDNGVFKFSYSLNGTTLPWETASVEAAITPNDSTDTRSASGMPLYTDWANMSFTQTGTYTLGGVSGKVYTATQPVTFAAPGMENARCYNGRGIYCRHPFDGLCGTTFVTVDDYERFYLSPLNLEWPGVTKMYYDSTTMTCVSSGGVGPKVSIWPVEEHDEDNNWIFPITLKLWVADDWTLQQAINSLVQARTWCYTSVYTHSTWKVSNEILNAWKNASLITGTNANELSYVSGASDKFGYRLKIGTSQPLLDIYPTKTNVHVDDQSSMRNYDAVMFTPEGITPPSNINIW